MKISLFRSRAKRRNAVCTDFLKKTIEKSKFHIRIPYLQTSL